MNENFLRLNQLKPGQKARVVKLLKSGPMRRRLQDLGFTENSFVECTGISPGGDPAAYLIKSALLALRDEDSQEVLKKRCEEV